MNVKIKGKPYLVEILGEHDEAVYIVNYDPYKIKKGETRTFITDKPHSIKVRFKRRQGVTTLCVTKFVTPISVRAITPGP